MKYPMKIDSEFQILNGESSGKNLRDLDLQKILGKKSKSESELKFPEIDLETDPIAILNFIPNAKVEILSSENFTIMHFDTTGRVDLSSNAESFHLIKILDGETNLSFEHMVQKCDGDQNSDRCLFEKKIEKLPIETDDLIFIPARFGKYFLEDPIEFTLTTL